RLQMATKNPFVPWDERVHRPSVVPPTFRGTAPPPSQVTGNGGRACLRFGSAGNGALPGGLFQGLYPLSMPGLRVVFAAASPEDGSQPLTISCCRGASGTRPARRLV